MKKLLIFLLIFLGIFAKGTNYDIYDGQRMYHLKDIKEGDRKNCKLFGDEDEVYCLLPATQEDIDNYLKTHDDCLGEYGCTLPDSDEPEDIWDLSDESGLTDLEKSIILNKIR